MEMPEEKTVITANVMALSTRVFSSKRSFRYSGTAAGAAAVIERHHEYAHEQHRGHGADPVKMRGHDAVLGAGRAHADHFLRAQIGGEKREAGDPDGNRAVRGEKIFARLDAAADQQSDAEDEGEVQREDRVVDEAERHWEYCTGNTVSQAAHPDTRALTGAPQGPTAIYSRRNATISEDRRIAMTPATDTRTLQGKSAIVTGGASGIGRAIAELFTARGARVHVVDMKSENGPHTHACDCADESAVERVFGDISSMLPTPGRIDILVNSVGVAHVGTLESTTPADFDHVMRMNVRSFYNTMRAVIGPMKAAGGGVILNLASIAATAALADRFAYSTSKGAVMAMTLSVAKDYLRTTSGATAFRPRGFTRPLSTALSRRIIRAGKRRFIACWPSRNRSGEWGGRKRWPRWRCSCVRTMRRSSRERIIPSTAVFSTCDECASSVMDSSYDSEFGETLMIIDAHQHFWQLSPGARYAGSATTCRC